MLQAPASTIGILAEEQLAGRLRIHPEIISPDSGVMTKEARGRIQGAWGHEPFSALSGTDGGVLAASGVITRASISSKTPRSSRLSTRNTVPCHEVCTATGCLSPCCSAEPSLLSASSWLRACTSSPTLREATCPLPGSTGFHGRADSAAYQAGPTVRRHRFGRHGSRHSTPGREP